MLNGLLGDLGGIQFLDLQVLFQSVHLECKLNDSKDIYQRYVRDTRWLAYVLGLFVKGGIGQGQMDPLLHCCLEEVPLLAQVLSAGLHGCSLLFPGFGQGGSSADQRFNLSALVPYIFVKSLVNFKEISS
jgi:hypothetical protein